MTGYEYAFVFAVVFVAALARSALGFGEALVAMPLLVLLLPARIAAPVVALVGVLTAALILARDWRHISFREAYLLTGFGMLAIPLGVWWLSSGDDRIAKAVLAVLVLAFSSWNLLRPDGFHLESDRSAPFFGLAAGLLSGAYNTGGPPLVIFGTLRRWPAPRFRATLQTYSLAGGAWVVAMHSVAGLVTQDVIWLVVWNIPVVALATVAGRRLTQQLPTERFIRYVHGALIVVGIWLLISCVLDIQPSRTSAEPAPPAVEQ